jgi:hypothetical protein
MTVKNTFPKNKHGAQISDFPILNSLIDGKLQLSHVKNGFLDIFLFFTFDSVFITYPQSRSYRILRTHRAILEAYLPPLHKLGSVVRPMFPDVLPAPAHRPGHHLCSAIAPVTAGEQAAEAARVQADGADFDYRVLWQRCQLSIA